jgi:hypothetical protein
MNETNTPHTDRISNVPTLPKSGNSTKSGESDLVAAAWEVLSRDPHLRDNARLLQIEEQNGTLVVAGRLSSFYLMQVLQTVLGKLDGVKSIENRIDVRWPVAESERTDSAEDDIK